MRLVLKLLAAAVVALPGVVQADIYKCVDEQGHVTYTNAKTSARGCSLLSQDQPVSTVPMNAGRGQAKQAAPSDFPKVDGGTQKARDNDRRRILEDELASEEKALDQARQDLVAQEAIRTGDERNYQRVLDRLQPYKDKVALHERNVEALKKEIANLR